MSENQHTEREPSHQDPSASSAGESAAHDGPPVPGEVDREIRILRARYWSERDPEGRAFAPLADACRRAGDIDEALELVRDGRERLPDYATGHLVAGSVYRAAGDPDGAVAALKRTLQLDSENVRALRELVELHLERDEPAEARERYRLLSELQGADPELESALGSVSPDGPGTLAATPEGPEGSTPSEVVEGDGELGREEGALAGSPGEGELHEGDLHGGHWAAVHGDEDPEEDPGEEDFLDLDAGSLELGEEGRAGDEPEEPVAGEPDPFDPALAAWGSPSVDEPGGETTTAGEADPDREPDPALEAGGAGATAEPALDAGGADATAEPVLEAEGPVPGGPVTDSEPAPEAGGERATDVEPHAPERGAAGAPAPAARSPSDFPDPSLLTRTMGELYARQGFVSRAVEVYEHLLARSPDEPELERRLEELRALSDSSDPGGAAGAPAESEEDPAALAPQWAGEPPTPGESGSPFAWGGDEEGDEDGARGEEGGRPVGQYFEDLLSWVPGAVPIESLAPDSVPSSAAVAPEEAAGSPAPEPEGRSGERGGEGGGGSVPIGSLAPDPGEEGGEFRPEAAPEQEEEGGEFRSEATPDQEDEATRETAEGDLEDFRSWLNRLDS